MKTYAFIGSDKNAGKTTVLNYIYKKTIQELHSKKNICLTSIGINGEDIDNFERIEKSSIHLFSHTFLSLLKNGSVTCPVNMKPFLFLMSRHLKRNILWRNV